MKKLVSLNTTQALYYEDGRSFTSFSPQKYVADLLAIRSAKGLVSFLDVYPEGLISPKVLKSWDENLPTPMPAWFSEEELTKATHYMRETGRIDIDWLDNLTDALNNRVPTTEILRITQEQYTEWMAKISDLAFLEQDSARFKAELNALSDAYFRHPASQLEVVSLTELKAVQMQLEKLLTMAAFASGAYEPTFAITFEEGAANSTGTTKYVKVIIAAETACALLPDVVSIDEFSSMWQGHKIGSYSDGEQLIFYQHKDELYAHYPTDCALDHLTDSETREIKRIVAGHLTAWALVEWLKKYSQSQRVAYDAKSGFHLHSLHANEVAICLCELVANNSIGLCSRCHRPFVVRRRKADGSPSREFCSQACKVNEYVNARAAHG